MSHFTVLVIGANYAAQLAPFHEFECTGEDDQYVLDVDQTPEYLKDYNEGTRTMVKIPDGVVAVVADDALLIHPTYGTMLPRWHSSLYKDHPEGKKDFSGKVEQVRCLPHGYEEIEVPKRELMTWREFVVEEIGEDPFVIKENAVATLARPYPEGAKWGYVVENDDGEIIKVVRRTNPNRKWDWYQVGGRWSGMFKLKPGATGAVGQVSWAGSPPESGYVDQACIGDIDFEGMRRDLEQKGREKWDKAMDIIKCATGIVEYRPWDAIRGDYIIENKGGETNAVALVPLKAGGIEAARKEYHEQEFIVSLDIAKKAYGNKHGEYPHFFDHDDFIGKSREEYATEMGLTAGISYAIVKDSQWYQKGEMGWFGMSSGDVSQKEWNEQFAKLVSDLPPDTLLTMVDCHI